MLSLETIEREINEIEAQRDTTYRTCERLAWLYIVRDHLVKPPEDKLTDQLSGSEFMEVSSGVNYNELMKILDEHLETLKLLYPKSYDNLIDRIRALR